MGGRDERLVWFERTKKYLERVRQTRDKGLFGMGGMEEIEDGQFGQRTPIV